MSKFRKSRAARPMAQSEPSAPSPTVETVPAGGFLARLFWMAAGNLILLYLAGSIARTASWTFTWLDVAFWFNVLALVAVRYVDVARFEGLTINAEPADAVGSGNSAVWIPENLRSGSVESSSWVGSCGR